MSGLLMGGEIASNNLKAVKPEYVPADLCGWRGEVCSAEVTFRLIFQSLNWVSAPNHPLERFLFAAWREPEEIITICTTGDFPKAGQRDLCRLQGEEPFRCYS